MGLDVKNRAAFEYSKRKFVSKYGPDLPVWALLASGSTGGVCPASFYLSSRPRPILPQIAYWLSSYPLGKSVTTLLAIRFLTLPSEDVVKSRVQLRTTPPRGTPVQYIAGELKAVVAESGA